MELPQIWYGRNDDDEAEDDIGYLGAEEVAQHVNAMSGRHAQVPVLMDGAASEYGD